MNCSICNAYTPSVESAIAADWIPGYWEDDDVWCDPCCPRCVAGHLIFSEQHGDHARVPKGKVAAEPVCDRCDETPCQCGEIIAAIIAAEQAASDEAAAQRRAEDEYRREDDYVSRHEDPADRERWLDDVPW